MRHDQQLRSIYMIEAILNTSGNSNPDTLHTLWKQLKKNYVQVRLSHPAIYTNCMKGGKRWWWWGVR